MNIFEFAPRISHGVLTSDDPIESGLPIRVWGIIFHHIEDGGTSVTASIQSADGSEVYFNFLFRHAVDSECRLTTPFIADKGLRIVDVAGDAQSSLHWTVYHSAPGS